MRTGQAPLPLGTILASTQVLLQMRRRTFPSNFTGQALGSAPAGAVGPRLFLITSHSITRPASPSSVLRPPLVSLASILLHLGHIPAWSPSLPLTTHL